MKTALSFCLILLFTACRTIEPTDPGHAAPSPAPQPAAQPEITDSDGPPAWDVSGEEILPEADPEPARVPDYEPEMQPSEMFFASAAGGFVADPRAREVRYSLMLTLASVHEKALYLEVRFQDPLDETVPLVARTTILPGEQTVLVQSEAVKGLKSRKTYRVDVHVFDNRSRTDYLGSHQLGVHSLIDYDRLMGW